MKASKVRRAIQAGSYETSPTTAVKANPSCSASLLETNHSHASQLAKSVCIFSPWQFLYWYDLPPGATGAGSVIQETPELDTATTPTQVTRSIRPADQKTTLSLDLAPNRRFTIILTGQQP